MKKIIIASALISLINLQSCSTLTEEVEKENSFSYLRGSVKGSDNKALEGVVISDGSQKIFAVSDKNGQYSIDSLQQGQQRLFFSHSEYEKDLLELLTVSDETDTIGLETSMSDDDPVISVGTVKFRSLGAYVESDRITVTVPYAGVYTVGVCSINRNELYREDLQLSTKFQSIDLAEPLPMGMHMLTIKSPSMIYETLVLVTQ